VSTAPVFVSRLVRLPLADVDGEPMGRIRDVVLAPSGNQLRVLGLVANIERRNIFINMNRIDEIDVSGVRMVGGTLSVRSFARRTGEQLAVGDLFDTRIGDEQITDLAIAPGPDQAFWYLRLVALGRRGPLRRRAPEVVPWEQVSSHFASTPAMDEVAALRDLHPTDVVDRLQELPPRRRQEVVELLDDEQVADLLEEMPEEEAVRMLEHLDRERAAHILEEMEPDDAVDLLADLPESERAALLSEMRPEESLPLRRLLAYDEDTAGGLMTPEPVVLTHSATVAEALATIRAREIPMELAAQVFVTQPPVSTPTGRFVGVVGFQRLLREAPGTTLEECVDDGPDPVDPDLPLRDVAERLASYDLLALPVCDHAGRLVGAVTVDDVLDHVLPDGWRRRRGPR
jgi:flagellar motility protein MotE (MotC chaperone)/sporulation protein YlmC with PRC-barrel domain